MILDSEEEELIEIVKFFEEEVEEKEEEANYAELEDEEEILLMSYVELNQSRKEDVWFLDSGCSNHMCANKEWFSDFDEEFQQSVKLGNNFKMTVWEKVTSDCKLLESLIRKVCLYFLAEKFEALTIFKSFKNHVEKEIGDFIRCLRTDRGGEFTSLEFNNFCKTNGISRQLTTVYTPQQNGVAEGKYRTIMNMVRSILSEKQVPENFWPEAVDWTMHVLNRSSIVVVKDMTPEEAWSGVKPNVDYFRVFGCIGHVYVSDNKRKKLDDKNSNIKGSEHDLSEEESKEEIIAEEEGDVSISSSESSESNSSASEESTLEVRNKRAPLWMEDYVSGREFSKEAENNNLVLLTSSTDPTTFEEVVQSSKWRAAMNLEIEAIERN
ncbi:uncharacterized protein LOC111777714 [Cucurbita pepo subsp. pepo]|uniref:uncharacterized protein LOC111777714 n=1 Tax=Cucurbita pepo subsp. pepo TaxID=3664 RepID=UPI000C9D826B|nr:uncharacterized protein LOC111777714 [Cucurbita pepo subsp. pepo]